MSKRVGFFIFYIFWAFTFFYLPPLEKALAQERQHTSQYAEVDFNPDFLNGRAGKKVDISRFSRGTPIQPGQYLIDVYLNDQWMGQSLVRFIAQPGSDMAAPCMDRAVMDYIHWNPKKLSDAGRAELIKAQNGSCANLTNIAKEAHVAFDLSILRLDLRVPQAALLRTPRGYVSPELWDVGVPSGTLSYDFNSYRTSTQDLATSNASLNLTTGLNYKSWHLRQLSFMNWPSNGASTHQRIATYLLHDMPSIRSRLVLGESFTDGSIFDSIGFKGLTIGSDDRMLPESQLSFAPIIRGIARTNARVEITQNGNNILSTSVPAGAFEISDLYATGYGGDLIVTVHEADGSQQSFSVPYTYQAMLLRPGAWRYNITVGDVRDAQITNKPRFTQAVAQYGFNNLLTGYTGLTFANNYRSGLVGAALNTPLGGIAVDMIQAKADIPNMNTATGRSFRIRYNKFVAATRTNINVGVYRFASADYWTFRESLAAYDLAMAGNNPGLLTHQRSQLQLSINQTLKKGFGTLFFSGYSNRYWNYPNTTTQYQAGYGNAFQIKGISINYNLSLSRQRDDYTGVATNRALLTFSIPLGRSPYAPRLSANFSEETVLGQTTSSAQETFSGTLGKENAFSYGVSSSQSRENTTRGLNGQYRSPFAMLSGSVSQSATYSQRAWGANGGVVFHPGGITLANQMLGDTIGVVQALGAEGARLPDSMGTRIDGRGYAVLPFLRSYHMNEIRIDPEALRSEDVEFKFTSQRVAPRADSVVMVRFNTSSGRSAMIQAHLTDGSAAPFGASVLDGKNSEVGLVGQDGSIFLRGIPDVDKLSIKWGDQSDEQCDFEYRLPSKKPSSTSFVRLKVLCKAIPAMPQTVPATGTKKP